MARDSLLQHRFEQGTVVATHRAPTEYTVLCILDPPLHAIGPKAHREAQRNAFGIYQALQRQGTEALPVALQEEFWLKYLRDKSQIVNERNLEGYLARGGFGAVAGILASPRPVHVIRLETDAVHAAYEELKNRVVDWVSRSAPAFRALDECYRRIIQSPILSVRLSDFLRLLDDHSLGKITLTQYLARLIETAESLEIQVPRDVILVKRAAELQARVDVSTVNWEMRRLRQEIRARANVSSLSSQSALELYVAEIARLHRFDGTYDRVIETCDNWLKCREFHNVDAGMIRYAADSIDQYFISAVPDAKVNMGYGEVASRLLELAMVVGIDPRRYPQLCAFVYQANLSFAVSNFWHAPTARFILDGVSLLESEIKERLAVTDSDTRACRLSTTIPPIRALGALRIGFGRAERRVLNTLSPEAILAELGALDPDMLVRYESELKNLQSFSLIQTYTRETIHRAGQLAVRLLEEIRAHDWAKLIVVCDGYFQEILVPRLRGQVSSTFIVPNFSRSFDSH